jgi:hypothetical protein
MADRAADAKRLDELAAKASSLSQGQALAAEADRLRGKRSSQIGAFSLVPLLRN